MNAQAATPTQLTLGDAQARQLRITIRESTDEAGDVALLSRALEALSASPGPHRVTVTIVTLAGERHPFAFSARITRTLRLRLATLLVAAWRQRTSRTRVVRGA